MIINSKTGNAPYSLLHCRLCESRRKLREDKYNYEEVKGYLWCISISCLDPTHKSWSVCYECKSQKIKLRTNAQLKLHHKRFHGVKQEKEESVCLKLSTSSNRYDTNLSNKIRLLDKNCEHFSDNSDLNFLTKEYNSYFLHEKNELGRNFSSAYPHFHLKDISDKLDKNDVNLDLQMSYFVSQITHNQRELFIDVINSVINKERRRKCSSCPSCNDYPNTNANNIYETAVPTTLKMIRKRYLKGTCSVNGNFPLSAIHQLENHAYISPIDVICDLLEHGLPLDKVKGMSQESEYVL